MPAACAAWTDSPPEKPTRFAAAAAIAAPAAEPVRRIVVIAAAPVPRSAPDSADRIRCAVKL